MNEGYTPLKDKEKDAMLNKARIQNDPEKERALRTSVDIDDLKNRRKKMKETYSDWRDDLREIYGAGTASMSAPDKAIATNQKPKKSTDAAKEIGDKKVNNKVVINPPMKEAFEEIGGVILSLHEADMSMAPSIKNAKPSKKVNVKYDSHMKVMAPTIKSEEHLTKQDLEKMQDDKDKKEARRPDNKPEVKENVADLQLRRAKMVGRLDMRIAKERAKTAKKAETSQNDLNKDSVTEKVDMKSADMGDVVKDFYKSDAPQFKGKSKKKRREMAVAAKLNAEEMSVADQLRVSQEYFKKRAARSPEEKKSEKESHIKSRAATYAKHKQPDPYKSRAGESD